MSTKIEREQKLACLKAIEAWQMADADNDSKEEEALRIEVEKLFVIAPEYKEKCDTVGKLEYWLSRDKDLQE